MHSVGREWIIDASGCDPARLRDRALLEALLDAVVADLGLKPLQRVWHEFGGEGGVTGMLLLSESHLTCHTYPEYESATFNLYCCRERPEWDWETHLRRALSAGTVKVTTFERVASAAIHA